MSAGGASDGIADRSGGSRSPAVPIDAPLTILHVCPRRRFPRGLAARCRPWRSSSAAARATATPPHRPRRDGRDLPRDRRRARPRRRDQGARRALRGGRRTSGERFTREALAAARLSAEPNIVTIFDVGESGGRPFIVMEYLAGGSLEDAARTRGAAPRAGARRGSSRRRPPSTPRTRRASSTATSSRRTSSSTRDGDVHVADFGIASAAGLDSLTSRARSSARPATSRRSRRGASARRRRATAMRSRVVAFELLTGERPFEAEIADGGGGRTRQRAGPARSGASAACPRARPRLRARAREGPGGPRPVRAEFVAALRDALDAGESRTQVLAAAARGDLAPARVDPAGRDPARAPRRRARARCAARGGRRASRRAARRSSAPSPSAARRGR